MLDQFTPDEARVLDRYVTNLDGMVFGLRNLPQVVAGTLFAKYSRSDKSLRHLLLDMMRDPEMGFEQIVGSAVESDSQMAAIQKGQDFYRRVLLGYGDDSVAELGGAHIAIEGISNVATKAIEDSRIGVSPLEKSSRYVLWNKKVGGEYQYVREPSIMASDYRDAYVAAMDGLFDTYSMLIEPVSEWVRGQNPIEPETSQVAYSNSIRAKTLDLLRGLLPMATRTNVGLYGNGRAFEYLLVKMMASPYAELKILSSKMQEELDQLIPSFVERAKSDKGQAFATYLSQTRRNSAAVVSEIVQSYSPELARRRRNYVQIIDWDDNAEVKVIRDILYAYSDWSLGHCENIASTLDSNQIDKLLAAYVGTREVRFHRPGRAFEEVYYTADVMADIGAYRDMHRHRMLTQERQRFGISNGYTIPEELIEAGVHKQYCDALNQAAKVVSQIEKALPAASEYAVPFAFQVGWRMKLNLREAIHLCELRSQRQGHPSYRKIAQDIYSMIRAVHPRLAKYAFKFVDMETYGLERLAAEQKTQAKLQQLS